MSVREKTQAARIADRFWRVLLFGSYRAARLWWFLRRPTEEGAYVSVWWQGQLLLIRNSYKPGDTVPCGGIRSGESPAEAARRELAEEVGIEAALDQFRFAGEVACENEYKRDHAHFFELELHDLPRFQPDGREVVWAGFCPRAQLLERPLVPALRAYLEGRLVRRPASD